MTPNPFRALAATSVAICSTAARSAAAAAAISLALISANCRIAPFSICSINDNASAWAVPDVGKAQQKALKCCNWTNLAQEGWGRLCETWCIPSW
jgi:hypothetical protein